jgi:protein-S-isoprenylcysteine O-methyltransferase Ste14
MHNLCKLGMTKEKNSDNAGVKIAPPLVFNLIAGAALALDYFLFDTMGGWPGWLLYPGILLAAWSFISFGYMQRFFNNHNTAFEPWETTSSIIKTGPFSYSRNPSYLFSCAGPIGFGLIFGSLITLLSFIPALLIVYYTAVKKEEAYLETKFGQEYIDYKKAVRRWI